MEGVVKLGNKLINTSIKHPHASIFCFLLCCSIVLNGLLLSSIGLPQLIDSLMHPNEYEIIDSDQFIILDQSKQGSKVLIQKQTHPSFSMDKKDTLCSRNSYGIYIIGKPLIVQNDSIDHIEIIGKVIMFIPDNSIDGIALAWWQQTKGFMQRFQS